MCQSPRTAAARMRVLNSGPPVAVSGLGARRQLISSIARGEKAWSTGSVKPASLHRVIGDDRHELEAAAEGNPWPPSPGDPLRIPQVLLDNDLFGHAEIASDGDHA